MIASYSKNAYGETLTNYTTYFKTYTPKWDLLWEKAQKTAILDILIKNVNGRIITDIYHKTTDT